MAAKEGRTQVGRPRNDQVDEAIHRATLSLLAEVGYGRVTIAEVARRASTVPPTIYRRYTNLEELVVTTLRQEFTGIIEEVPDHGTLRADLIAHVDSIAATLTPQRAAILAGLLLPMRHDSVLAPELAAVLRQEMEALNSGSWAAVLARAVHRGELEPAAACLGALSQVAPYVVIHRLLLLQLPLDDSFVAELVDTVLLPSLRATTGAPTTPAAGTTTPQEART